MAWWSGDRGEEKAKWRVFRVFRSIKARNHTRVSNHQKDRRDKKEYPKIGGSVILAAAFSPSAGRSCYVGYRTDPFPPLATHSETPTHTLSTQHSKHIPQPHAEGICFITGPFVSLSVTHTLCAMEDEKTHTGADALPFGDEGRCVQAPPLFPKTHGMQLWSLWYVTQHQWNDASPHHSVSFLCSPAPSPLCLSVCPLLLIWSSLLQRRRLMAEASLWLFFGIKKSAFRVLIAI